MIMLLKMLTTLRLKNCEGYETDKLNLEVKKEGLGKYSK